MIKHHTDKLQKFGDCALVLCSFDGAEYVSDKTNVISFTTQIYLYAMEKTITTTTTRNLYTWQEIIGPEKRYVVLQAVKKHFQEKQEARKNITKIGNDYKLHYCLTHNYKMLYVLLPHVHWACNNHPYPLCKCNCGDGAIDNEKQKCEMIFDDDHLIY